MPRQGCAINGGFTLIEVLVAMTILGVGLLGLAGMQIAGMRGSHSAYLRTQATFAAYDLADRMRSNPGAFVGNTLTIVNAGTYSETPAEFAAWAEEFVGAFPAPASDDRARVNCDDGGDTCGEGNCEILLRWDDSRTEGGLRHAAGEEGVANRNPSELEFHVCARLPG
jgi:type IV pilus assembly protein PilV